MRPFFILCVSAFTASGSSTWFVRPVPGSGSKDGTSYANGWSGITNIHWASISPGDTIYVCGTHVANYTNLLGQPSDLISTVSVSGITIRGDYTTDPYTNFAGRFDWRGTNVWLGPDANGVYHSSTVRANSNYRQYRYTTNALGAVVPLTIITSNSWPGFLGAQYFDGITNWLKPLDGNAPIDGAYAINVYGWRWDLNNQSNITFIGGSLMGATFPTAQAGAGLVTLPSWKPNYITGIGANHITFQDTRFLSEQAWFMYPGHEVWTWTNCEFARAETGVYSIVDLQPRGPWNYLISHCYFHDIAGQPGFRQTTDGHAIGCQGGSNWTLANNVVSNTSGIGVDFHSEGELMTNVVIKYNLVCFTRGSSSSSGSGIAIDSTAGAARGTQAGFKIFGNIVHDNGIGGAFGRNGIGLNISDQVLINNNTIQFCDVGITVFSGTNPVDAIIKNNIISNPTNYFVSLTGNGTSNSTMLDYNLFFTNSPSGTRFNVSGPPFTHDAHSKFASPLFVTSPQVIGVDFQLSSVSSAIAAGIVISSYTQDYLGHSVLNPPSIGAFEFITVKPPPVTNLRVTSAL